MRDGLFIFGAGFPWVFDLHGSLDRFPSRFQTVQHEQFSSWPCMRTKIQIRRGNVIVNVYRLEQVKKGKTYINYQR
jgi:hypothetical protein